MDGSETGSGIVDLSVYKPAEYNLLVPTVKMAQSNPLYRVRVVEVQANPDPNSGDVFEVGSRREAGRYIRLYSPQKPLLERIANAAGVILHPSETRLIRRTPRYAYYVAVGAVRTASGEWVVATASKEIDLDVIEDELQIQYEEKCENAGKDAAKKYGGEWIKEAAEDREGKTYTKNRYVIAEPDRQRFIADSVRANMIQWRKNLVHRAETGAILRLIRRLLGMKSQYTQEELRHPFILARVDFSPDYRDEQVKNLAVRQGLAAMGTLYGSGAGSAAVPVATIFEGAEEAPPEVDEDEEIPPADQVGPEPTGSKGSEEPDRGNGTEEESPGEEPEEESTTPAEGKPAAQQKCQHPGCGKILSTAEIGYSARMCDGAYCMAHQKLHKKAGGAK